MGAGHLDDHHGRFVFGAVDSSWYMRGVKAKPYSAFEELPPITFP